MTRQKAIELAAKWAEGGVCTLLEGEAMEYHKICLDALRAQQEREKDHPRTSGENEQEPTRQNKG